VNAPVPTRLGRYEIQEEIGRGMMGVVYRAVDPALGRTVALKTVQLAWAISDEDRQNFEKRFMAEARTAASLSHPGIVVVHDIGHDSEAKTVFIAMEHLHGRTLAQMTAEAATLEWREALRITARVAEALHAGQGLQNRRKARQQQARRDAGARQQKAQHDAGGPAPGDGAGDAGGLWLSHAAPGTVGDGDPKERGHRQGW